jgi:hypothetical protein
LRTDDLAVGDEDVVDVEDGDWEYLAEDGRVGWQDMADFAATLEDSRIRGILEDAVQGKGAFSRFRRAIDRADLKAAWYCFSDDRLWGRGGRSWRTWASGRHRTAYSMSTLHQLALRL